MSIAVTGANGRFGSLLIQNLLKTRPASSIIATARNTQKLAQWESEGVQICKADYTEYASLINAFQGAKTLMLVSSPQIGSLVQHHFQAIEAAKEAGVSEIVYLSVIKAPIRTNILSREHRATEILIEASGLKYTFLRAGWYLENWVDMAPNIVRHGSMIGCAKDSKWSAVTVPDLAEGAAKVLTSTDLSARKTYEFAGDEAFTHFDFTQALSEVSGKRVSYQDLDPGTFEKTLGEMGMPQFLCTMFKDYHLASIRGHLQDETHDLSKILGRPTKDWKQFVRENIRF